MTEDKYEQQKYEDPVSREGFEPTIGWKPAPFGFMIFISLISFWGGYYLIQYGGGFSDRIYDETATATSGMPVAEFDPMVAGEKFFMKNCKICHQANGMGLPGVYPPLAKSNWVQSDEERLVKILLKGMKGPVIVNGESYNGQMPTFGASKNRDIASVLTWIRGNEWGNAAAAVTEEKVAEIRAAIADQTDSWQGPDMQP